MRVSMYGDNAFRYRLEGARLWITLLPGQWHNVEFSEGDRVQINSTTNVTHLKIHGHISNVFLENSELEKIDDSFSGTKKLDSVEIRSSAKITSMDDAFNGSGIINITIPTKDIESANRAYKDTSRIDAIQFEPDKLNSANEMFSGTNSSSIDRFKDTPISEIENLFKNSERLSVVNEIDISLSSTNNSEILDFSKENIALMDIMISRGKILLKKYSIDTRNIIDPSQNIEIDIEPVSFDICRDQIDVIDDGLSTLVDDNMNIEIDIEPLSLDVCRNGLPEINDGLDQSIGTGTTLDLEYELSNYRLDEAKRDDIIVDTELSLNFDSAYKTEVDVSLKRNNLLIAKRENNIVETNLLEDNNINDYKMEVDVSVLDNEFYSSKREDLVVETGLDIDIDNTMNIEIDIQSREYNIDPFDDGSCIFSTARVLTHDYVSGIELNDGDTSSIDYSIYSMFGDPVIAPTGSVSTGDMLSQDVKDWALKSFYCRVKTKKYNPNDYTFIKFYGSSNIRQMITVYGVSNNMYKFRIYYRKDNDSSKYHDTTVESTVYAKIGAEFSVAIIESSNSDEFNLLINGEVLHTYTIVGNSPLETGASMLFQYGDYNQNSYEMSDIQIFNKTLTQADIKLLDTK